LFGKYIKRNNIEQTLSFPALLASNRKTIASSNDYYANLFNNDYHLQFILNPQHSQRPGAHAPCAFYGTRLYPATVKQMIPRQASVKSTNIYSGEHRSRRMNMKFLVTGAAGFIGFHASQRLLEAGHEVVGIDNMNDYYDVNLKQSRLDLLQSPCSVFTKPISPIAKAWRKFLLLRSLIA
jgi:hypothetical protein